MILVLSESTCSATTKNSSVPSNRRSSTIEMLIDWTVVALLNTTCATSGAMTSPGNAEGRKLCHNSCV